MTSKLFERRHRNWLLIDRPFRGERSEPSPTDWSTSSGTLAVCFGLWRASPNHFDVIYSFDTRLVEEVFRIGGDLCRWTGNSEGIEGLALRFRITAEVSGVRRRSNRKPAFRCHFECRSLVLAGRQSCGAHNAQPATATVYFDLPPSPLRNVNLRVQRKRLA